MRTRVVLRRLWCVVLAALLGLAGVMVVSGSPAGAYPVQGSYKEAPLQNCPDPATTKVESGGTTTWYLYCTTGPINDKDKTSGGGWARHLLPMYKSTNLIDWSYVGDAFSKRLKWASTSDLWAPEIQYFNGKYYLYYTVAESTPRGARTGQNSAIGVATSTSPTGPWTDSGGPVVEAQTGRWVFDPFVISDGSGQPYIFYGSYAGGLSARKLSADRLKSDKASETQISVGDRYEGAWIQKRGTYYYLFASSTSCCNDELTGYSVFAGRSTGLLGPYLDRQGVSFLDSRVGGTPVLSMNGNRFVGPGHTSILTDYGGKDWAVYHGVNRGDPHFAGSPGFTKRAALLDPIDWLDASGQPAADGWPVVRGGLWASESHKDAAGNTVLKPAAQPGEPTTYKFQLAQPDAPGTRVDALSDEFDATTLSSQWSWVREPAGSAFGLDATAGTFRFNTQSADLHKDSNNASVLTEATPAGDYLVETKVSLDVPPSGSGYNHVQAGLVVYGDDNSYVKLVHVAINGTRQTEFAKETSGGARYGNTVVGPPADWTYLRVAKRANAAGEQTYTAYTSRDGATWERGGTWTHQLGSSARIGLVSMGGSGYTAHFDYVRLSTLAP